MCEVARAKANVICLQRCRQLSCVGAQTSCPAHKPALHTSIGVVHSDVISMPRLLTPRTIRNQPCSPQYVPARGRGGVRLRKATQGWALRRCWGKWRQVAYG